MKIKIGKIELEEWVFHEVVPPTIYRPYRMLVDDERCTTCIYIDYKTIEDGTRIYWLGFTGRFKTEEFAFLEKTYQYQEFSSFEEAKEYIDNFLIRINNLIAFA